MAQVPNFMELASAQGGANYGAANLTNQANRPNQYDPLGSITWGRDANGNWTQSTNLSGGAQGLFDQTMSGQGGLMNLVNAGAPQASFGAQQNVIDAWNALQQPGLQKAGDAARARAAAQGITLGSTAMNDVERTIGTNEATSRNQGILQGVDAYNKMFTNQLGAYNANRGALGDLTNVRNSLDPNKWASDVPTSANYSTSAPNLYGAALDTFSAQQANENAAQAQSNANTSQWINGAGTVWDAIGGMQGIKDIWGGVSDWFGGSGGSYSDELGDFIAAKGW